MNSLTSRPRSPMRAITLTSAAVWRAIMPRSVLFPTPEPEKMAIRWPFPIVSRALTAFTPTSRGCAILFLRHGVRGLGIEGGLGLGVHRPFFVNRAAHRVQDPAQEILPDPRSVPGTPREAILRPGSIPRSSPRGMSRILLSRNPTTSAGTAALFPSASDEAHLPDGGGRARSLQSPARSPGSPVRTGEWSPCFR